MDREDSVVFDEKENNTQYEDKIYNDDSDSYDIFEGLDETGKKRPRGIGTVVIAAMAAISIISFFTFANIGFIRSAREYLGSVFDSVTVYFTNTEEENRIKKRLGDENIEKTTHVMPFENAANARYIISDGDVVAVGTNYISRFSAKGKVKWQAATSIVQPLADIAGDYIVLAESGNRGICLYYKDKLLYSIQASSPVFTVDVSEQGDVVVATDKEFFKGGVEVYNRSGKQIFSWNSGAEYIMAASISRSSRRVAAVLMNADNGTVSNIRFFDINKTKEYYTAVFEDSAVFSVEFIGNVLDITSDNGIAGLGIDGKTKWYTKFTGDQVITYARDKRGDKLISAESDAVPKLYVYAEGGKLLTNFELNETPSHIDIMGRNVLYNQNRTIYFGTPGSEKQYMASMDIKQLKIINAAACLVVYNNSLEFIS